MAKLLAGRIALVTGGSRGLGRAIAAALADAGACGLICDVAGDGASDSLPTGWMYHQMDVAREDEVVDAVRSAIGSYHQLDIAVANAGIVPPWKETTDLDMDAWRRTFDINVAGVAHTIKHAAAVMKGNGGSIIAMGSLNSWQGHPRQAAYVASKHAVHGLVRAAAHDLGRFGIRVNALAPGPVLTRALLDRIRARAASGGPALDDVIADMAKNTALGRTASAEDVANVCLFLASDLSAGITGHLLPVDAGIT